MKIDKSKCKYNDVNWFFYYYRDSITGNQIYHGLFNDYSFSVGYFYHDKIKGFYLINKNWL